MGTSAQEYVGRRAELLANIVLTRRQDVSVISIGDKAGFGIDLFAFLKPITKLHTIPFFGIQIKGTATLLQDEKAANRYARQIVPNLSTRPFMLAPVALMAFSMEGDQGYWGWLMEPFVGGPESPSLSRVSNIEMRDTSHKSLERLFSEVTNWFDAMGTLLHNNSEAM